MAYIQDTYDNQTAWLQVAADSPNAEMRLTPDQTVTLRRCLTLHVLVMRWRGCRAQLPRDLRIVRPELDLLAAYAYYILLLADPYMTFIRDLAALWPSLSDDIVAYMPQSSPEAPDINAPDMTVAWDRNDIPYPLTESVFAKLRLQTEKLYDLYTRIDRDAVDITFINPAFTYSRPRLFSYDARGHAYSYAGAMLLLQWGNALVKCMSANNTRQYFAIQNLRPTDELWNLIYWIRNNNRDMGSMSMYTCDGATNDLVRQLPEFYRSAEEGRRARLVAFALASQPRAGDDSPANVLDADTMRAVLMLTEKHRR